MSLTPRFWFAGYGITAALTALLSLLWLYWLSAITLLSLAADRLRICLVFSSMFNECFFSFWFARALKRDHYLSRVIHIGMLHPVSARTI
jgi:hypothetical protein